MIRLLMRLFPPGSFAWLTLHEFRLARRARRGWADALLGLAALLWTGVGVLVGFLLRDVPLHPGPPVYVGATVAAIGVFSFMTTQALLASQRTLYEAGDLDLLFSAPLRPRSVISAKLVAIVAAIAFTFALLILPVAIPVAAISHPELWGIPALLVGLALTSACVGLAVTLFLARIAGPRAARTVGQIVAALAGGALFLLSQAIGHGERGSRSGMEELFHWMMAHQVGTHGIAAIPGRAAFGDLPAMLLALGIGVVLFAVTSLAMQTWFLSSYRAGGMKLGRTRRARTKVARHFRASLFASVFAKEWRLLARDPALLFQIVLRLIYLIPLFLVIMRPTNGIPFAPALAFASVVIAGQVTGSFAWLTVSAEDTPDLLAVAPVAKADVNHAKLMAAMAMGLPLFVLLPAAIATETIPGALVAFGFTAFAGWITGQLELAYARPAPRSAFRQRAQGGSWVRGILQMLVTTSLGAGAGAVIYFLL